MDIANLNFLKKNDTPAKEKNNSIVKVIKGSAISIILTLIFLSIYAALLSATNISEATMVPVVLVITGISILIGSSMSTVSIKSQGMLNGFLVGLIYMAVLYIISSIMLVGFEFNLNSVIMLIVGAVTGMIGGVIGVNIKWGRFLYVFKRGNYCKRDAAVAWHTYLFEDRCVPFLQIFARKDVSLPCKELYTINYKTIDLN